MGRIFKLACILLLLVFFSCLHSSIHYIVITPELMVQCELSEYSVQLVEQILIELEDLEDTEYYEQKLVDLIKTPTINTPEKEVPYVTQEKKESIAIVARQYQEIVEEKGDSGLEDYLNQEELYEQLSDKRLWKIYRPSAGSAVLYIVNDDPNDILVHINIAIRSSDENKYDIYFLEDAVEKHLSSEGFSVNIEFVERSGDDVFEIESDPSEWPTSGNLTGGHTIIAHEVMHLMGLADEYDRIKVHATNPYLNMENRLYQFLLQLRSDIPPDAEYGIMCYHNLKPLQRHICEAVNLGKDCVKEREKRYGAD
jgi:hypothetical protein